MCNLNIKCQVWDGSCGCCRPSEVCHVMPMAFASQSNSTIFITLFNLISQQNELIAKASAVTRDSLNRVTLMQKAVEATQHLKNTIVDSTTPETLLSVLSPGVASFDFRLTLISEPPQPAYKERAFSLMFNICNNSGEKIVLKEKASFSIQLFTTESPPKLVLVNTSGDKVLRGTTEAEGTSVILFKKIIINEVSSHFRDSCLFLVVSPKENQSIKPFIIENLIIKARKIKNLKKPKLQESVDLEVLNNS